jgi:hypothetical protein
MQTGGVRAGGRTIDTQRNLNGWRLNKTLGTSGKSAYISRAAPYNQDGGVLTTPL